MKLSAIQKLTLLDYPDKVACIAFTPGCNLRCGFCHNPEFVLPERLAELAGSFIPESHFLAFLEQRRKLLQGVVVSGGEPTVWSDLPEFLGHIKERGFAVKLDTNGNHPQMVEHLIRSGLVDYFAMDVKTSLEAYGQLVGPGVQPERIAESIDLIRNSGVEYEFRTTLIREHHTADILRAVKQLLDGAKRVYLQTFRPGHTLIPAYADYHAFSPEEMESIAVQFRAPKRVVGIRV